MENLDTGKDKIKKICEILKNETLQPAKEEAQKILEVAEQEARNIIRDAEAKADSIIQTARDKLAKEKEIFESSLQQAFRQGTESLKQNIEKKLFNPELNTWIEQQSADPEIGAKLINALIAAIEKEGTSANFSAYIPAQVPADKVNALLARGVLDKLREKSVVIGDFKGGIQVKLHDRQMTLDLSDVSLKELVSNYIRKDFREILFK
jgi:V/A-type H+-transporting ATPase subunit E